MTSRLPPGSVGYVNLVGFALISPTTVLAAPLGAASAHRLTPRRLVPHASEDLDRASSDDVEAAASEGFERERMSELLENLTDDQRDVIQLRIVAGLSLEQTAATLGKPVWNLLWAEGFWLYGTGGTTPWYPSMRLYRQSAQGDWAELFARVEAGLRRHLAERKQ